MTIAITIGEVADNNVARDLRSRRLPDGHYFADVVAAKDIEGQNGYGDRRSVATNQKYGNEMTDTRSQYG